jgi:hypothetical protein
MGIKLPNLCSQEEEEEEEEEFFNVFKITRITTE